MIPAPLPENDKELRESLYKLNILDTPLEERFERITRLACMVMNVPIAAFTLIDQERQWFKSIQGMDGSETSRAEAFCAYTILGDDIMIVPDARKDARFSKNPFVTGKPNITFYAGCPVRAPDGRNIGSLCAIDSKTRTLSEDQLKALEDLAKIIESELKVAQLSKTQYDLINELDAAHRQSLIDSMTRLWNQKGIDDILKREWASCQRNNVPLAVVMADIAGFDQINTDYGRTAGDDIIKDLGKRFLAALRAEDAVARITADKFMIVLPGCLKEKLQMTLERINEMITAKAFATTRGPVQLSIRYAAVIETPDISMELSDLLSALKRITDKAKNDKASIEIGHIN